MRCNFDKKINLKKQNYEKNYCVNFNDYWIELKISGKKQPKVNSINTKNN